MKILIFGAGGVGGHFGARLYAAGANVCFVARGEHLKAIRQAGLSVETPDAEIIVPSDRFYEHVRELPEIDVVLLCVKAWQMEETAKLLQPILHGDSYVIPLQNSIESSQILGLYLSPRHVVGGVTYTIAQILSPGRVRVLPGTHDSIIFGELNNESSQRTNNFLDILQKTPGISGEIPANIQNRMWKKFVWIATVGAIGAYAGTAVGEWRNQPKFRELFKSVLHEAFQVAASQGTILSAQVYEEIVNFLDSRPPGFTTSMQRDIAEGRRSELDFQLGGIVRLGAQFGVSTPSAADIFTKLNIST